MEISVRAIPAQGHDYRRRAGRTWGKTPVVVKVVDEPKGDDEISPTQYAQLAADPHISAVPVGNHDPAILDEKAGRIAAQEQIAKLRKEHADYVEQMERELRKRDVDAELLGQKIQTLEKALADPPTRSSGDGSFGEEPEHHTPSRKHR